MVDAVQGFIARKEFSKAIDALRAQSQAKPHNRRIRVWLCDIYQLAGRDSEAVPVLLTLADQFATDGFAAKAIAILKRIEKLQPGRADVERQLAALIQNKSRRTRPHSPPKLPAMSSSGMAFGLEVIDPSVEIQLGSLQAATPAIETPAPLVNLEAPELDPSALGQSEDDDDDPPPREDVSTPLFDGLSPEELVAVMRGLELVSFEPGDLITVEGEEGDSMFILAAGRVKVHVRPPSGRSMKVAEFGEGDFFGEIAVITGKPRTATLTAAEKCDCLVLDRAALDKITELHPRVAEVLRKFQEDRAMSTLNTILANRAWP